MSSTPSPSTPKKKRRGLPAGSVIFVIVLFIATLNFAALVPALNAIQDRVYAHQSEVAERVESELDGLLTDRAKVVTADLTSYPHIQDVFTEASTSTLAQELSGFFGPEFPDVASFSIVDISGDVLAHGTPSQIIVGKNIASNVANEDFFTKTLTQGTYSSVVQDASKKTVGILATKTIYSDSGALAGVAVVTLDVQKRLAGYAEGLLKNEGERIFLYDDSGYMLDSYDTSVIGKNISAVSYLVNAQLPYSQNSFNIALPFHGGYSTKVQERQSGVPSNTEIYVDAEGVRMQATLLSIPDLGLTVVFSEPYAEAWGAWREILALSTGGIVLFTLLSVFLVRKMMSSAYLARELEKGKRHTDAIVSNLVNGIIQYDAEFRILLINPTAATMLGIDPKKVIGKIVTPSVLQKAPQYEALVKVMYPAFADNVKKYAQKEGLPPIIEMKLAAPKEMELQVVTVPITTPAEEGAPETHWGYVKILRDVSREKAISRTKSEFISVAAHQLRTPLSAIKWVFRMLLDGDMGALVPEQHQLVQEGYDSNQRIIQLVGDMLNVARIEEGRFGYEFSDADITDLIEEVLAEYQLKAHEKNINLTFTKERIGIFKFDPEKMQLVLQNLVSNALKYTPKDGVIVVDLRRKDKNFIEVSVTDSGIGIPKDQVSKLFTKFFRASNAATSATEGTGLGLFITKNIVERHGGQMDIETEEGKGTTFRFTLPTNASLIPDHETVEWDGA